MSDRPELFSARERKKERGETPTNLQYDHFPDDFRMKVIYAVHSAIPWDNSSMSMGSDTNALWRKINTLLKSEHGVEDLSPRGVFPPYKWQDYLRSLTSTRDILDSIEAPLKLAVRDAPKMLHGQEFAKVVARTLERVNQVFNDYNLGYQFIVVESDGSLDGLIIRSDSEYLHEQALEPAIGILHGVGYVGPLQEFLEAHREHRRGKHKSAVNEALKAFESTMKAICRDRGVAPGDYEKATATKLIQLLLDNGVIPKESESFYSGVRTVLESGTPTIRNRQSGHGQGPNVVEMRDYSATFALNIAASAIVFLVSAHNDPTLKTTQCTI